MMNLNAVTPQKDYGRYASAGMRTDRDAEYDAFSHVTRLLSDAKTGRLGPDVILAIHKNNELWAILATDLAQPGNLLPDETRAGLLSLAGFAIRHGHSVLNGSGQIDPLIEINVSMMKGLRGEVSR